MPYITSVERYGLAQGLQEGVEAVLALKFGAAGKRLRKKVREIHNVDVLRGLLDAVSSAKSIQEIRERLRANE